MIRVISNWTNQAIIQFLSSSKLNQARYELAQNLLINSLNNKTCNMSHNKTYKLWRKESLTWWKYPQTIPIMGVKFATLLESTTCRTWRSRKRSWKPSKDESCDSYEYTKEPPQPTNAFWVGTTKAHPLHQFKILHPKSYKKMTPRTCLLLQVNNIILDGLIWHNEV